ncbi:Dysbindin, partial [Caligus rogercresseyi]
MLGHLKEIVKSLSNVPVSSEEPKYIPENVDLEAANQWERSTMPMRGTFDCHEADATILKLKDSLDSHTNTRHQRGYSGIMNTLGSLDSSFTDVEIALFALEDTIETRKLQEKQLDQRFQIAIYQERRQAEFNDLS